MGTLRMVLRPVAMGCSSPDHWKWLRCGWKPIPVTKRPSTVKTITHNILQLPKLFFIGFLACTILETVLQWLHICSPCTPS